MRHGNKLNRLGRKSAHRKAMMANMATSLIIHKRIRTTLAKAKALRVFVEPLITKSKNDTTHSRRTVFSYLRNKEAIKELFGEVAARVADRPGGYTRILKLGNRPGDNSEMALIELVDFNEFGADKPGGAKSRRRRRGGKKGAGVAAGAAAAAGVESFEEVAPEALSTAAPEPEVVEEMVENAAEVAEETVEEVAEAAAPEADAESTEAATGEETQGN